VSSPSGSVRPGGSGPQSARTVSLVTLGCARNEVDSEELAARLAAAGWDLAPADEASVVVVNTCGFIQAAKQESISELLAAAGSGAKVAAVGCLAERYGADLADELPEAQILSFDDYGDIGARLDDVLAGRRRPAHTARDRRSLLPISPAERQAPQAPAAMPPAGFSAPEAPAAPWIGPDPGHGVFRRRLSSGVVAPLKIASGCDRRCTFCAIPSFRGAFVSRRPPEILAEARWLASQGVRELMLVSENSTSYGKDLGNLRLLEEVLPDLAATEGIDRVRISYLQPAELRPGLIEVIASTPGVAAYFDLSFQHASGAVLRAMRRFGDRERFLGLLDQIREISPNAGVRSNFIVGFPGETADDLAELEMFLGRAGLDAIGIFGYSDEDGTEAASRSGKLDEAEVARRVEEFADLAEELMAQRAADRLGETLEVLIEEPVSPEDDTFEEPSGDIAGRPGLLFTGTRSRRPDHRPVRGAALARRYGSCRGHRIGRRRPDRRRDRARRRDVAGPAVTSEAGLWNVANVLTIVRIALVPVFVACLLAGGTGWRLAALAVFGIASFTDLLDGKLARRWGLVTDFGKIADPVADKALTGAALICLSALGELPWWVTGIILFREIGVTVLRFWVIRRGVIAASRGGKLKTLLQIIAICLYVLPESLSPPGILRALIMGAAVVVTVVTGVDYVLQAVRLRRSKPGAGT
jgi:ribosomal protein S12 methylthiotransferase